MGLFAGISRTKLARYAAIAPHVLQWALKGELRNRVRAVRSYPVAAASGLFDAAFYTAQPGYEPESRLDPLQHYLLFGFARGLNPNPLFDTSWYLAQNPDVVTTGINPLVHFATSGWSERRNPHALFNVGWYLEQNPDVKEAGINPLVHFLRTGGTEGLRSPHPLFDSRWYFERNPDVAAAQVNPLIHYLRDGWNEGRNPHPLFHTRYYMAQKPDLTAQRVNPLDYYVRVGFRENVNPNHLFDCVHYRGLYPDMTSEVNPLLHYLLFGGAEFRSPHPLFDALEYSRKVPQLSNGSGNPLVHYFQSGIRQKLSPHCLFDTPYYLSQAPELIGTDEDPILHYFERGQDLGFDPCELFDTSYYLERYPQVRESGQNALVHFVTQGAFQGYNPNPLFDISYYLRQNGDVVASKQNALVHYLQTGAFEGRSPSPFFDSSFYLKENHAVRVERVNPLADYLVRGGAEKGRNPNSYFKTASYVKEHPEVTALGINPLVHFTGDYSQRKPEAADTVTTPKHRFQIRALANQMASKVQRDKTTVICVSHVSPLPPRAGNEYRIFRLLQWLRHSGYNVMPVLSPLPHETISDEQLADVAEQLGSVILCLRDGTTVTRVDERAERLISALDGVEVSSYESVDLLASERIFCHDALVQIVERIARAKAPCVVVAEYVFMSRILPLLSNDVLKVIDTHDVFSSKQKKVVARGVSDALSLTEKEEARMLVRADLVLAIQPEEQEALQALCEPRQQVITAGVDFLISDANQPVSGHKVLFIASDNPMNARGLREFLRFSWPSIVRVVPDAELLVAGKVCRTVPFAPPQVTLLGSVENLDPLYTQAKVVINPALAGTGLKIKTLEALSFLRPLVTWPTGADGLHPNIRALCLLATDWFEFSEKVVRVLNDASEHWFTLEEAATLRTYLSAETAYSGLDSALNKWARLKVPTV